jgi:4-diphosphocytidyl-2-C-methyl-D-erythritol kinase
MLTVLAPAKINLVLEVIGKRDDGYHEISSLMHTINMYDTLSFELDESVIYFECTDLNLQTADNLIIRAAKSLLKVSGYKTGAKIYLEKRIPLSSGLGGGSSDAAATLLALNELWGMELKIPDLVELAAELGSDIPFFIHKGMALIKGRGETVIPLPPISQNWFVLMVPPLTPVSSKTKYLYSLLTEQLFTKGEFMNKAMNSWAGSGQITSSLLFNVFDSLAFDAFPGIAEYWDRFKQSGANDIHLAGSGPTLFTSVASESQAKTLSQDLCDQGISAFSVSTTV